jgi:hypothetical protein
LLRQRDLFTFADDNYVDVRRIITKILAAAAAADYLHADQRSSTSGSSRSAVASYTATGSVLMCELRFSEPCVERLAAGVAG